MLKGVNKEKDFWAARLGNLHADLVDLAVAPALTVALDLVLSHPWSDWLVND